MAAPVARWFFLRRYKSILRQGADGLAHHLGTRLLDEWTDELPPLRSGRAPPFDLAAAVGAGCAAGISSTFLQMGMWQVLSYPVWNMLLRDSRLAAAIVLGPGVLPPPPTFDPFIMLVASVLHFALSATYGLAIAALVNRMKMTTAVGLGAISGLLLFILNMGGFTSVFPWFVASRDTATAVAHLGFGVTAAACYRYAQPLGIRAHSH
ncbi:sodium:proline symporter [Herbaspirillum sp. GCM10030257]|uniref:sodium:proline symporter n=1 Tax=Herbaspirillum sp. GCM10030257 TaxID=3273393 RepID=UPI00360BFE8C